MKQKLAGLVAIAGIGAILISIIFGPTASPPEFDWLKNSTSEQAGQQVPGAWIMRAGFLSYGLGTFVASLISWRHRPPVRIALVIFGAGLIATAIWSNASILPGTSSDMHEDWLHSVASGLVGVAFAAACAARLFAPGGSMRDRLAWTGLIVSVVFPVAMGAIPEIRGLIQRVMFAVSFLFVGREFLKPET